MTCQAVLATVLLPKGSVSGPQFCQGSCGLSLTRTPNARVLALGELPPGLGRTAAQAGNGRIRNIKTAVDPHNAACDRGE